MIEFFQITGSSSFAVRGALEEIGVEYRAIDVVPFDRGQTPELATLNPWRTVPALRDGEAEVHEIGACLLYLAERFPQAGLAPAIGDPARGAYLRWLVWLADTFRPLWERIMAPRFFTTESEPGVRAKGLADLERVGEYLENSWRAVRGASASSTASPTSTSTCSSAGSTTSPGSSSGAMRCRRTMRASVPARRLPGRAHSMTSTSGRSASTRNCAAAGASTLPKVTFDA